MNDSFVLWTYRLLFAFVLVAIMMVNLLPVDVLPGQVPAPDIAFCFIAAWILRRSDYSSVVVIAGTTLLMEIIFFRPPGLWTALVLLAAEYLRRNAERIRYLSFPAEWTHIAVVYLAISATYHLLMTMSFVSQPNFRGLLLQVLVTVLLYPLIVAVTVHVFRVRKPSSTEVGILRART